MSARRQRNWPRFGLVLGSGGARGIAHVVVLETLDRLGARPVQIAGTSIGAILGAAYAAGASGAQLRAHMLADFRDRADVMARLFQARVGKFADLWRRGLGNPVLIDGEGILQRFLPRPLPPRFEDLAIPLAVVAADIHRLERVVFTEGPLQPAIAASMAIPGLVRPAVIGNRVLIDGGAVDPLPVRAITADVDMILAIDVSRAAARDEGEKIPGPVETGFRVFDLMQAALADAHVEEGLRPVRRLKAPVEGYNALDFFSARKILAASESLAGAVESALTLPVGAMPGPSGA
ncbi:patatin-like phospholipase family protein [Rhabdaerophilum calidifontis]|uniref:patatin-like phospholipase family protein n=1 Tax=Rhabdaerophilum calidifontis TaxID=2604328 RepID=UPI001239568C|nr:patatin-like phospholipase family protein [Rhabdaerophilum calidifontis]